MRKIKINRAPVLTLWAVIVAEHLGYDHDAAMTLGKAVAGMNAQSKGRSLGIFNEPLKPETLVKPETAKRPACHKEPVALLGRSVTAVHTEDGLRALEKGQAANPESTQRYLASAIDAMETLAGSLPAEQLAEQAYALYEQFRPAIPGGKAGWGGGRRPQPGPDSGAGEEAQMTASPILNAAYAGDVAVVSALLAQDRTLANARGEGEGATPLAMAACGGCLAVVQLLVDAGADINAVTNDGTALLMAAWFNHLDIVAWLLDHGADPNEASASGETPLHAAALKGFLNVGQVLIARGAAVNCRTTTGTTDFFSGSPPVCGESPLHLAGAYGHLEFIELLLQNGADKIITDHTGQTPLHWAARYRQDAAYQRLR